MAVNVYVVMAILAVVLMLADIAFKFLSIGQYRKPITWPSAVVDGLAASAVIFLLVHAYV